MHGVLISFWPKQPRSPYPRSSAKMKMTFGFCPAAAAPKPVEAAKRNESRINTRLFMAEPTLPSSRFSCRGSFFGVLGPLADARGSAMVRSPMDLRAKQRVESLSGFRRQGDDLFH